ncbi:MAG: hypothetical protein H7Y10_07770 [Flavobacterium sp.]|nr:hypothetical protein [Flavobacterium sp.]
MKSILILASIFMLLLSTPALAQADPGDDPDVPAAPIDGGITLLIAAGVLYGAKKVNDRKNK